MITVETVVNVIVLIAIASYFGVQGYLMLKGKSKEEILKSIKDQAHKLFLYAEKQGWTGPDKMAWCAEQIVKLFPEQIRVFVKGPIESFMQTLYDEFKKNMYIDNVAKLGIKVDIVSK